MNQNKSRSHVVFDGMVYLQALFSKSGPAAAALRLVESGKISLYVSHEILDEVRDVLSRPKIRQRNAEINDERVEAFLKRISEKAVVAQNVRSHFTYARDPKDEKYINLAVEVEADYLVSRDKDLLDLMTGPTDECKNFRQRFRKLTIIEPVAFLKHCSPTG